MGPNIGPMNQTPYSLETNSVEIQQENARFMSRVYTWMTGGVLLSGVVAHTIASSPELSQMILGNRILFYALFFAQLGAVLYLSLAIRKMSALAAAVTYLGYCALTGATLSVIFFIYTQQSILNVFALTAFSFAGLSGFGYLTKRDLGPVGSFCMMGLFGLVGFSLLSLFFPGMQAGPYGQVSGIVGVIVFSGLTAYDTQKIKAMNIIGNEGTDEDKKEAIYGALKLYLDFINLFLSLLRVMGGRRK
jgi:uncharacterized protein